VSGVCGVGGWRVGDVGGVWELCAGFGVVGSGGGGGGVRGGGVGSMNGCECGSGGGCGGKVM